MLQLNRRRRRLYRVCAGLFLFLLLPFDLLRAGVSTHPVTNKGRPWRVGYYEGGDYLNYPANLKAIYRGLAQLGWLEKAPSIQIDTATDTKKIWEALSKAPGRFIEFVPDAYWSCEWDQTLREKRRSEAIEALKKKRVDLMIAMGTWAGRDLVNNQHDTAVMVVSASDPVQSEIIKSAYDSGYNHVHARCDPTRYKRQLRLFHSLFRFNRLGLVYEDTLEGRTYAAIADIKAVAAAAGFKVISCNAPFSSVSRATSTERLVQCHRELAPKVDAFFVTVHRGVDEREMDKILAPLMEYKIPTWSQRGPQEVRRGVLMSIARKEFSAVGRFHAGVMAKIFNGASPRALNQIFKDPKAIAINLRTAAAIGFHPPKGLMKVVDEIYE